MGYLIDPEWRFCYGLRLVRLLRSRWPLLGAALAAGALLTISIPSHGSAESAPALADRVAALGHSESAALLELYAAESALARASVEAARLSSESEKLASDEQA